MSSVLIDVKDHIGTITINKPESLNALSTEVINELNKILDIAENNKDIYCLIITGAGDKSFVAGADISEMKDMDANKAKIYGELGNKTFLRIENFRCPVIAAVNGFALGGGCELAMSCDIRVASSNARFAQPETGLGITPGFGGTQRMARLIGMGLSKELIYTCRQIKSDEALSIGLVNKVVEQNELIPTCMKIASDIASKAPIAVSHAKSAINNGYHKEMCDAINVEVKEFSECFNTSDQKKAMTAFVNKDKNPVNFENK